MFASLARALFGTANDRSLKAYQKRIPQINALEPAMQALSDDALRGQTALLRARLAAGCLKPSPPSAKVRCACSACAISTCR